jgi:Na+-transporting NADH:ubiquinone oxidoreductase subunit NqrC
MSSQSESKNGSQKKIMIIIAFIVLIAALVVCVVLLFLKPTGDAQPTGASDNSNSAAAAALERGFVSEDSAQDIVSEMADKVAEGMFECKMTTSWTFDDAESASHNAYVANVESNKYTLYFDVVEEATNEIIYSSPMLPVGTDIKDIKLEKPLAAGDYNAVVMYTLVDENYEEVSSVGFKITISIVH